MLVLSEEDVSKLGNYVGNVRKQTFSTTTDSPWVSLVESEMRGAVWLLALHPHRQPAEES